MALMKTETWTETRLQPWPVMQDHLTSKTVIVVARGSIYLPRIPSIPESISYPRNKYVRSIFWHVSKDVYKILWTCTNSSINVIYLPILSIVNKVALESEVLIEVWYYMLLYGNCSGKRTISWIERWAGTGRESTCQKAMDKLIIWGRGIDQEWDDYKWWYISLNMSCCVFCPKCKKWVHKGHVIRNYLNLILTCTHTIAYFIPEYDGNIHVWVDGIRRGLLYSLLCIQLSILVYF